jgi:hypothetical protein
MCGDTSVFDIILGRKDVQENIYAVRPQLGRFRSCLKHAYRLLMMLEDTVVPEDPTPRLGTNPTGMQKTYRPSFPRSVCISRSLPDG